MTNNSWINFSEDELKEQFESIKAILRTESFINVNTIDDLLELKVFIFKQLEDGYFKSDRHKNAYLLTKYETGAFNEELGITRRHFKDKKLAKEWMSIMQATFHPDKNKDIQGDIDFTKVSEGINRAYGEMVGRK
ncbi:hypothetical protein IZS58_004738 [Vibrio parahaemolyticus]|nr:hypothetical protein [Vibrio parahaemolyticus]MDF4348593.1 hypothetical protein [Vibrio parahaemolyticus]